jgi:hypothetical protein
MFFAFFPQTELEKIRAISEKVFLEFQLSLGGGLGDGGRDFTLWRILKLLKL